MESASVHVILQVFLNPLHPSRLRAFLASRIADTDTHPLTLEKVRCAMATGHLCFPLGLTSLQWSYCNSGDVIDEIDITGNSLLERGSTCIGS